MSTAPSEDSQTSLQSESQFQDPAYTKYLPYLLSGELADITIFAPLPPGTHETPPQTPASPSTPNHAVNQHTPIDLNAKLESQKPPIPTNSLFLTSNQSTAAKTPTTTTTTTTTTLPDTHTNRTANSLFSKPTATTSTTTVTSTAQPTPSKSPDQLYMTFNLHRFIVAARSPVLAILLHQSPVLTISLRSDVFQALIWTMYTDTNDRIPVHLYPHIVWAAEYYAIKPAQIWALQTTIRLVSKDNMVQVANHLLETYAPIQSSLGAHSSASLTSSKSTNHLDAITPILSIENCPKSFTYLCDFILNLFYTGKDGAYDLQLHKLHPAMVKLIMQTDPTLSPQIFQ